MRNSYIFVSLLFLSACKSDKEKLIVGKWNAIHLLECDEIVPINTNLVNLEFQPDGKYVFNSTLNVHEEGEFKIEGNYLYTKDKVKTNALEKAVKIRSISSDSLVLEMNFKGKEQWLTMLREGSNWAKSKEKEDKNIVESAPVLPDTMASNKPESEEIALNTEGTQPIVVASSVAENLPKTEDIKVGKPAENKPKILGVGRTVAEIEAEKREGYLKREAARKKQEAEMEADRKRARAEYLKREADRDSEAKKSRAAYLRREKEREAEKEADRKIARAEYLKREAERKKKKK